MDTALALARFKACRQLKATHENHCSGGTWLKRPKMIFVAKWTQLKLRVSRIHLNPNKQIWIPAVPVIAVSAAIALSVVYWGWLRGYVDGVPPREVESPSTTIRNLALGVAAFLALAVAVWRGWVANRQAETSEQQLLNERYQKATEMLGSPIMTVRLGGIYQLQRLADEQAERYHIPVSQSLCGFVLEPPVPVRDPSSRDIVAFAHVPADIRAALEAIQDRDSQDRLDIEVRAGYWPDLRRARLPGADLTGANLSEARLDDANLSGAVLERCDFHGSSMWGVLLIDAELLDANLCDADLFLAYLDGADFTNANLSGANVTGATFSVGGRNPAKELSQLQIGSMRAERGSEPDLSGVVDANSGEPLVWNGFTIPEELEC